MLNDELNDEEFMILMEFLDSTAFEYDFPQIWKKLDKRWIKITEESMNQH